jgi:hypothetical protein
MGADKRPRARRRRTVPGLGTELNQREGGAVVEIEGGERSCGTAATSGKPSVLAPHGRAVGGSEQDHVCLQQGRY